MSSWPCCSMAIAWDDEHVGLIYYCESEWPDLLAANLAIGCALHQAWRYGVTYASTILLSKGQKDSWHPGCGRRAKE